jgi:hypothetical protein
MTDRQVSLEQDLGQVSDDMFEEDVEVGSSVRPFMNTAIQ